MQSLAEFFGHNFDDGFFWLYDKNGHRVYYENVGGDWAKYEYNINGKIVYVECFDGYWQKYEYNEDVEMYFEDSNGLVRDKRPKAKTIELDGKKYKLVEIQEEVTR